MFLIVRKVAPHEMHTGLNAAQFTGVRHANMRLMLQMFYLMSGCMRNLFCMFVHNCVYPKLW